VLREELDPDPIKTIGPSTPLGATGPFKSSLFRIKLVFEVVERSPM
jgi:hypothetical protein